jgi:hypothetical protein
VEVMMGEELKRLVEEGRSVKMSAMEKEEQRRSFAYGNTAFENPRITREMVEREAKRLAHPVSRDEPPR